MSASAPLTRDQYNEQVRNTVLSMSQLMREVALFEQELLGHIKAEEDLASVGFSLSPEPLSTTARQFSYIPPYFGWFFIPAGSEESTQEARGRRLPADRLGVFLKFTLLPVGDLPPCLEFGAIKALYINDNKLEGSIRIANDYFKRLIWPSPLTSGRRSLNKQIALEVEDKTVYADEVEYAGVIRCEAYEIDTGEKIRDLARGLARIARATGVLQ